MSSLQSLLTLWLIYMGVALTPGINFALIGQTAARYSRREALVVSAGVVSASAVWLFAAVAGLVAVVERAGRLFDFVRVGAAIYLIVLGLQRLRSRDAGPGLVGLGSAPRSLWRHYAAGFFSGLGNPKAILFFGTLFATAFPADASSGLLLLGALLVLISSVAIHAGLASLLSAESFRNGYLRTRKVTDRIFGVVFVAFGARLLAARP